MVWCLGESAPCCVSTILGQLAGFVTSCWLCDWVVWLSRVTESCDWVVWLSRVTESCDWVVWLSRMPLVWVVSLPSVWRFDSCIVDVHWFSWEWVCHSLLLDSLMYHLGVAYDCRTPNVRGIYIFIHHQGGSTVYIRRLNKIYNSTKKQRMKQSSPNAHAMRYTNRLALEEKYIDSRWCHKVKYLTYTRVFWQEDYHTV